MEAGAIRDRLVLRPSGIFSPDVIEDILAQLRMPDAEVVHTGFYPMAHYIFALCSDRR